MEGRVPRQRGRAEVLGVALAGRQGGAGALRGRIPSRRRRTSIEHALTSFGQKALEDPELLAKIDEFAVDVAVFLVARYQDEVAELIASTVAALGSGAHVAPRRAGDRPRPAVHPHQRHDRRRTRRNADLSDLVAVSLSIAVIQSAAKDLLLPSFERSEGSAPAVILRAAKKLLLLVLETSRSIAAAKVPVGHHCRAMLAGSPRRPPPTSEVFGAADAVRDKIRDQARQDVYDMGNTAQSALVG